jgi:hypothetical protein
MDPLKILSFLPKGAQTTLAGAMLFGLTFIGLEIRYAHATVVMAMSSASRVGTIFDLVKQGQESGGEAWVCRAIEEELIQLCSEMPEHYLCNDKEAMENLRKQAGCA